MSLYIGWNPSEGASITFAAPNAAKAGAYKTAMELIVSVNGGAIEVLGYDTGNELVCWQRIKLLPYSTDLIFDYEYSLQFNASSGNLSKDILNALKLQALCIGIPCGPEIVLEMNHLIDSHITKIIRL